MLNGWLWSPHITVQKWQNLNLDRQGAILKAIIASREVDKVIQIGFPFKFARIRPNWSFNLAHLLHSQFKFQMFER